MPIPPFSSAPGMSQSQGDARYVNVVGDTMTGDLERQSLNGKKSKYKRSETNNALTITNESESPGGGYGIQCSLSPSSPYGSSTAFSTSLRADTYSICFWVKSPITTADFSFLVSVFTNTSLYGADADSPFQIVKNSGLSNLRIRYGGSSGSGFFDTTGTPFDNSWHFIALTYDGSQFKFYMDGVNTNSHSATYTPGTVGRSYKLGFGDRGGFPITGSFDEIQYYTNRVLSSSEIIAKYNSGLGLSGTIPDSNLVCGLHFNEGSGTSTSDYSGNGNTVTLVTGHTFGVGKVNNGIGSGFYENEIIREENGQEFFEEGILTMGAPSLRSVFKGRTIRFFSGSLEKMRISEDGNIGFGTTSPDAPATFDTSGSIFISFKKNSQTRYFFTDTGVKSTSGNSFNLVESNGSTVLNLSTGRIGIIFGIGMTNGGIQFNDSTSYGGSSGGLYTPSWASQITVNNGAMLLGAQGAAIPKLVLNATASQTADIFQVKNSSGTVISNINSGGSLRVSGIRTKIRTISSSTTLLENDSTVKVDASSSNVVISLPTAASLYDSASQTGAIFVIKRIDSSGNTVTLDPNGSETIDGLSTLSMPTQWQSYSIQTDGVSWFILN